MAAGFSAWCAPSTATSALTSKPMGAWCCTRRPRPPTAIGAKSYTSSRGPRSMRTPPEPTTTTMEIHMKIILIGVSYLQGKYLSTKTVTKMLQSVGHELAASPAEGVTCCVGRLMPYEKPVKPDVLLRAEALGLTIT